MCRAGLTMVELPIQRLVLILPPDEQPAELLEGLAAFPPMPGGRLGRNPREEPDVEAQAQPRVVPPVRVEQPDLAEEIVDLLRPQRAPRTGLGTHSKEAIEFYMQSSQE